MAKTNKTSQIGLSFGSEDLFAVQHDGGKISALADITSDVGFSLDMLDENGGAEHVGSNLKDAIENNSFDAKNAALSIDLSMGLIVKIPYEKSLTDKDLQSHLKWELEQYIDDDVDEYTFDSYKLIQTPTMKNPELVMVGARTKVIDFFQNVCKEADLRLAGINIDVIAATNAFEANYSFKPKEKVALVEIGEKKLIFTLLEGTLYKGHHYQFLDESVQADFTGSVTQVIGMNLKSLYSDLELGKTAFDHVFLYRSTAKFDMNKFKEMANDNTYDLFNPFLKVKLNPQLSGQFDKGQDYSEYAESVGLALQ